MKIADANQSAPFRHDTWPAIQDPPAVIHSYLDLGRFLGTRVQHGRKTLRWWGKEKGVEISGEKEHRDRLSVPPQIPLR